jgi:hypothetical protein
MYMIGIINRRTAMSFKKETKDLRRDVLGKPKWFHSTADDIDISS